MVLGCRGSGAASGGGTESPTAKLLHSIFIGSTSQYLLKHAHVPVVLVRDGMGVPDTSATMEGDVDVEMFAHILGN
ncbi:hypothetical protein BC828DRAFT_376843 [Blastocladiella britannica]|nr:hypothetical protein BC828DRAFT_376843 [Blastocladiella britannica]